MVRAGQIDKERTLANLPLQVVARMLVLSSSGDSAAQYMNYMNVFFTAQKLNIPVDVCMIGQDSGLLQQGSDITGGLYIKVIIHRTCTAHAHYVAGDTTRGIAPVPDLALSAWTCGAQDVRRSTSC